jgi:o-succinylbenzoate---CoA ligase
MEVSAWATGKALGYQKGERVLLALSPGYVAGKMVLVRALLFGMEVGIVEPSSAVFDFNAEDFAPDHLSLVPLQVRAILQTTGGEGRLQTLKTLLVGGAAVDSNLAKELEKITGPLIYETYGMTETLSHIALKRINGKHLADYFTALEGVEMGLTSRGTLRIKGEVTGGDWLETRDLAEMKAGPANEALGFRLLGRSDSVINSGGVKVSPESVEAILESATVLDEKGIEQELLLPYPFLVVGRKHDILGEEIILLIQSTPLSTEKEARILESAREVVPAYHSPRRIEYVDTLPTTANGKPLRRELRTE